MSATPSLEELKAQLDQCMIRDRHGFRRRIGGLERRHRSGKPIDRGAGALARDMAESQARAQRRHDRLPTVEYPAGLPVVDKREDIRRAIEENQVVVVCGETGSGKTTQLPKIALEAGQGVFGQIGHTQPRRIAARSVASRIAEELETPLGESVGYKIRFSDRSSPDTHVKLMTDGVLLAEIQSDRFLNQYDTLIIDEAHERSLNIDFILGYLKQLLPKRPDLKVIITSATIDPERFSRHFDDAPIILAEGRTYPVEVRYRPLDGDEDSKDRDLKQGILDAVDELARLGPGDVLVFLSGEREIREAAEALRKHHPPGTEVLPLYSRLSAAEQNRVFRPHQGRRIVLATNVAETSLTLPGIKYVVDPGTARISRYSARSKIQHLQVEPISQASANQRKGRCGRVSEGVCIRLYSEEDFESRPEFTDPEILRTNLASVILQMESLRLGHVDDFPFVEPPESRQIRDGYHLLFEIGAVDADRRLTKLGRRIARLPIDPRLGRMLLAAEKEGCLRETLIVVSALSIQDPRERPLEKQQAADEKHRRFHYPGSDFLTVVNLWDWYHGQSKHLSQNKLRKLCKNDFLSYVRMREWREIHRQLRGMLHDMGIKDEDDGAVKPFDPDNPEEGRKIPADAVHRSLLTGLLGLIGQRIEEKKKPRKPKGKRPLQEFQGARNRRFAIFPGSGLAKQAPKWLMAAQMLETSRVFAHTVAAINPRWLEELGDHLVVREYSEPHWQPERGQVAAFEKVTLFGLVVSSGRKVNYGPVNPAEARQIFIRQALVEGELDSKAPFFHHNRELVEEVRELEAKSSRPDVLVEEERLFEFFDQRVPEGIYSAPGFEKWRRQAEREDPRLLFLDREFLMRHEAEGITANRFPKQLDLGGVRLPLEYHFSPGQEDDGVTLVVPLGALNQVSERRCEWLVPGLLEEKMAALIKSLPKQLRKNFVPAPEFARACRESLQPGDEALTSALSRELGRMTGAEVPAEAWDVNALPEHLLMRYRVVDGEGQTLAAGRDLAALRQQFEGEAAEAVTQVADSGLEQDEVTDWDFGELPETVEVEQHGIAIQGYPALVDEGKAVALRVLDSPEAAREAHHQGLIRLIMLRAADTVKHLRQRLPGIDTMCLQYSQVKAKRPGVELRHGGQPCEELKEQIIMRAVERAFLDADEPIRDRETFQSRLDAGRGELVETAEKVADLVGRILAEHHAVRKRLKGSLPFSWVEASADIQDQLDHLVYRGFVLATPDEWLREYPRYLQAVSKRLDKLDQSPDKDRLARIEIQPLWEQYKQRAESHRNQDIRDPELEYLRWMIEELRVSLFAQELRTRMPVSPKRVARQLEKCQA